MSLFAISLLIVAILVFVPIAYWIFLGLGQGIRRAGGAKPRRRP